MGFLLTENGAIMGFLFTLIFDLQDQVKNKDGNGSDPQETEGDDKALGG